MPSRLTIALTLSLALHGVVLLPGFLQQLTAPPRPPALQATLRRPALPPEPPPLADPLLKNTLDREDAPVPRTAPAPATQAPAAARISEKRRVQAAQRKLSEHLFYPSEAVARGLQGEVRLILKLSATGAIDNVAIAASSGHPILDNAAIRAAYAMGRLGGEGARELILPVIFRLQ